ncbi:TPA: HicB family protein, partial [Streptococcus suis]|nr:HicB family protein [Streptococcus suis]
EFPKPSSFKALASNLASDDDVIQAISVDTELVRERERSKIVNKTVTLPSWLVEVGKENKVNFSQLLQKAIREELQV